MARIPLQVIDRTRLSTTAPGMDDAGSPVHSPARLVSATFHSAVSSAGYPAQRNQVLLKSLLLSKRPGRDIVLPLESFIVILATSVPGR